MSAEQTLRVEVQRTAHDYRAALFQLSWRRGSWTWTAWPGVVAGLFVFFTGVATEDHAVLERSAAVGVLIWLLSAALCAIQLSVTAARIARSPVALAPVIYEFSESGLSIQAAYASSQTAWKAWAQAIESRDFFFLLSQGGAIVHSLPKRQLDADLQMRLRILLNDKLGDGHAVFVEQRA